MKVLCVAGTRPEAIKMAPVINRLNSRPAEFDTRVCVTGQHRELLDQVFDLFELVADHDLDIMSPGQSLSDVTSAVLRTIDPVLEAERPDWVLVQGDTTTAMAATLAAFYQNIPVGHIEAGLRTGDVKRPFPEEANRRITSLLATAHFAPTEWAAENLRREGVPDSQIYVTGNTVVDAFRHVESLPFDISDTALSKIPLDRRLVVATVHRRENFGSRLVTICSALRALADMHREIQIVVPVHPNPKVKGPIQRLLAEVENITLLPPLDYRSMVWLLGRAHFLITDSGGIQEEATGVGRPALVLRDSTERPEGVAAGNARLVGADPVKLLRSAHELIVDDEVYAVMSTASSPYGTGRASHKIVDILSFIARSTAAGGQQFELDPAVFADGRVASVAEQKHVA